jgi:hypothetical protein
MNELQRQDDAQSVPADAPKDVRETVAQTLLL